MTLPGLYKMRYHRVLDNPEYHINQSRGVVDHMEEKQSLQKKTKYVLCCQITIFRKKNYLSLSWQPITVAAQSRFYKLMYLCCCEMCFVFLHCLVLCNIVIVY